MSGASGSWSDASTSLLTQAASVGVKALDYIGVAFPVLGTVSQMAQAAIGQSGNVAAQKVVQIASKTTVNTGFNPLTTAKAITPNFLTGILSGLFPTMDLANSNGVSSSDASKATGGGNVSSLANIPFWVKTAIVGAVLIGTTLIIKGNLEK